jgi:hypothetical protein
MLGDLLGGGDPDPEPDIVVRETAEGMWEAVGPLARSPDVAPTLPALFETIAYGRRRAGAVVEVRTGSATYRTTIEELRMDYDTEYREPRHVPVNLDDKPDPFYDFV